MLGDSVKCFFKENMNIQRAILEESLPSLKLGNSLHWRLLFDESIETIPQKVGSKNRNVIRLHW